MGGIKDRFDECMVVGEGVVIYAGEAQRTKDMGYDVFESNISIHWTSGACVQGGGEEEGELRVRRVYNCRRCHVTRYERSDRSWSLAEQWEVAQHLFLSHHFLRPLVSAAQLIVSFAPSSPYVVHSPYPHSLFVFSLSYLAWQT